MLPTLLKRFDIAVALPAGRFERIEDRRAAIARAIAMADRERDLVLLAGKGHERGQIVGTTIHPFDDVAVAREAIAAAEPKSPAVKA